MTTRAIGHGDASGMQGNTSRAWRWATFLEDWTLRHRRIAWLLIIAFYLLSMNGLWRVGPDSALYLCLGRSIARGEGYVYQGETHRMAYPGVPYLVAAAMRVSPDHAILIVDAVMVGCALIALAFCEQMFRLIVRPGTAIVVTVMLCCSFRFYSKAFEVLTDMPFFLGTVMVLLGGALSGIMPARKLDPDALTPTPRDRRAGWLLLPVGLGICAVMRPTFYVLGATIVLAWLIALVTQRKWRQVLVAVAVVVLLGLLFWLISRSDPRRAANGQDIYEEAVAWQLQAAVHDIGVPLANAGKIITPELPTAFLGYYIAWGGDVILVALLISAAVWILWRWPAAIIWIALTLALQFIVEPVPRYMMPILLLLVLAWWTAAVRLSERLPASAGNVITICAYLLLFPNACRCVGQIWYEQYQRPFLSYYDQGRYAVIDEMSQILRTLPPDAVIIAPARTTRLMTFMADRWCPPLEQPIPEHMRGHPLFVVYAANDKVAAAIAEERLVRGEKVAETQMPYDKLGPMVLCRAKLR